MKINTIIFSLIFLFLTINSQASSPSLFSPFSFTENKGQVVDQFGAPRPDVRFIYNQDDFRLILRATGFSYEFMKTVADNGSDTESGQAPPSLAEEEDVVIPDVHFVVNRIDIDLVHCNKNAEIAGEGSSPFYDNYFNHHTGFTGITQVHSFEKVIYKNIYNGIDLVFYTMKQEDGKIIPKYEFVVNPSGNMNNIMLSYSGQQKMNITSNGCLQLEAGLGFVNEGQPRILFEDGSPSRKGSFILDGSMISFEKIKHDKDQSFIIDPAIDWGTYYGGKGKDIPDELATDSKQNIYLTGRTRSLSMIATTGAHQTVFGGSEDAILLKFDTNGNLVWSTYHGGTGNDVAFAITIDPFDNIYIGGRTVSPNAMATPGAVIDTFSGGLFDVFLAKFNPAGVLQWGTYMGHDLKDEVQGLATNPAGELYVTGYTESLNGISTPGSYKAVGDTAGESFLMKFTPDGQQLWGTYYGGIGRDRAHGLWVNNGHVYETGTTNSKTGIATPGSFQDTYTKLLDAYLSEWSEDGQLVWGTYIGGNGDDRPRDVRTDDAGNLYVVGQTESENKISTPGAWKTTLQYQPGTNRDGFVEKFTPAGARVWGTYFGGNRIEMPRAIRVSRLGAPIWIGGYTKSDSGLITKESYQIKLGGFNDGFIAKFNWDGSDLMYSTYYGGAKSESITEGGWYGSPMEMDQAGNIYLASCTQSFDSIATPDGYKTVTADSNDLQYDYFIAKFSDFCSDPFEPNDTVTINPAIPFNPKTHAFILKAQIQKKNDRDYFVVRTQPGMQNLKIHLSKLPVDAHLFVYDSLQVLVNKSQNTGLIDEEVIINNAYLGKYFVLIKAPYPFPFDETNCYLLTVTASDSAFRLPDQQQVGSVIETNVTLYPNPARDAAEVILTCKQQTTCHVEIRDLAGRSLLVFNQTIEAGENTIKLGLKKLNAGSYLVEVQAEEIHSILKLEVQK